MELVRKILVIEDEPKVRDFIRAALEPEFEIIEAGDGQEGVNQARLNKPDVILLDLRLPRLDGLTVLARIKSSKATSATPVVIISAKGHTSSLLDGQKAGAVDYLIKPFTIEDLRVVVRQQLTSRGD